MRKASVALLLSKMMDHIYHHQSKGETIDAGQFIWICKALVSQVNYSRNENKEIIDMLEKALRRDYVVIDPFELFGSDDL